MRAPSDLYTVSANSAPSAGHPFAPIAVAVAVVVVEGTAPQQGEEYTHYSEDSGGIAGRRDDPQSLCTNKGCSADMWTSRSRLMAADWTGMCMKDVWRSTSTTRDRGRMDTSPSEVVADSPCTRMEEPATMKE